MDMHAVSQQDTEVLVSRYRALVDAGHYLRSNEPLVQLWAVGGDDLLQRLYDEAMSRYEADPNDKSNLIFAANLSDFLAMTTWQAALERLKTDLPDHPFTEMMLGTYLVRTGDKETARPHLDRALALGADNPDMVAICASFYGIDYKMPERARDLIQQVLQSAPDVAWYYAVSGDIHSIVLNDHAAGFRAYDQAVALSPHNYQFRNMRALSNITLGNHTAAIADLEYALKANPNSSAGRFALLKSYLLTGDKRGAADTLLTPRLHLLDGGILDSNHPATVAILPTRMFHFRLNAAHGTHVTITVESDDVNLVAPFAALIDPHGEVSAHSGFYASQGDTPDARVTLRAELTLSGSYTLVVCQNMSTWMSIGDGELRVTLSKASTSAAP